MPGKGFSLLLELTGDERILDVFKKAVQQTMAEVEADVIVSDSRGGKRERVVTGNAVHATFIHRTSRPVQGDVDPHLHAHTFLFNLTKQGERWAAVEFRPSKSKAPAYEQRFLARMSRGLGELGYQTKRKGRYFEIDGIQEKTLRKFSNRTTLIERVAETKGITNPRFKAELGGKTRERKKGNPAIETLREEWASRLTEGEVVQLQSLWEKATGEKANAKSLKVAASLERDAENWLRKRQGMEALPEPRKPEKKKTALFLARVTGFLKRAREKQLTKEIDRGYHR